MNIEKILGELGLPKNKGAVYLAALQVGTGSVQDIAVKAGLPRTTTHEILGQLVKSGVANLTTRGRTQYYTAESPKKLLRILQDRQRKLEDVLPELLSMTQTSGIRPRVRFYEGVEGVKTVFEDTLTVRSKLLQGILSMADLFVIPGKPFMMDYVERRVRAGIQLHVIR
ncbi:MAG: helix-turn-helix domain-containing protein, partial [Candidatus Kerfeldbacteria bacterium]|nr:helix-turn-helix domain-containing protein [Candidatus Kerfeldbacteria bacterium]